MNSIGAAAIQDPAKAQRDRQYNSTNNSATAGDVDTYMNTVASYVSKESDGNTASFTFKGYNPSSNSPPAQGLDWSVFDPVIVTGDGNSYSNSEPATLYALYKLARVVTTLSSSGTWSFQAFDTANLQGVTVSGEWGVPEPTSAVLLIAGLAGFLFSGRPRLLR